MRLPLFLQPRDTYERHWVAAQRLRGAGVRSVLDVGGEGLLRRFLPSAKCLAINIAERGDLRYGGHRLPFSDGAFEAVVSLDTLEHLPRAQRPYFVAELCRVAQTMIILATPYGSETHKRLERQALEAYKEVHGRDHDYLREHVEYGLPTQAELTALFEEYEVEMRFCGNCEEQYMRFVRNLRHSTSRAGRIPVLSDALSILRNANLWRTYRLDPQPCESSNRVYVFASK